MFGYRVPMATGIGTAGVLLFFVHTSLVLMLSLERRGSTIRQFYIQRFFRIYPLAVLVIVLCVSLRIPADPLNLFQASYEWHGWTWLVPNLLLIQNLTRTSSVTGPLWSLPFEVQMYLLLPFIFLVAKSKQAIPKLLALSVASVFFLQWLPLLWAPFFLSGVIAFVVRKNRLRRIPAVILPLAIAVFVVLNAVSGLRLGIGWLTCTAFGFLLPRFAEIQNRPLTAVSHVIARYSYGIYLAHVPILWFSFVALRAAGWLQWLMFAVLIISVPVALFHVIENPFIQAGRRITASKGVAVAA
jgi:peptidoglycan/LPS O-acetylase OafA/YrhL